MEFALGIEDQHALVVAVGGIDAALRVYGDAVDHRHLAVALALLAAKDPHELPFRRELDDALVGVSVGDEDVSVGTEGHDVRTIEGVLRRVVAGDLRLAERQQQLARRRELADRVIDRVSRPHAAVRPEVHAVRLASEEVLIAPLPDRRPFGGEEPEVRRHAHHHDDGALAVGGDPRGGAAPLLRLLDAEVAADRIASKQARERGRRRRERRGRSAGRRLSHCRCTSRRQQEGEHKMTVLHAVHSTFSLVTR